MMQAGNESASERRVFSCSSHRGLLALVWAFAMAVYSLLIAVLPLVRSACRLRSFCSNVCKFCCCWRFQACVRLGPDTLLCDCDRRTVVVTLASLAADAIPADYWKYVAVTSAFSKICVL